MIRKLLGLAIACALSSSCGVDQQGGPSEYTLIDEVQAARPPASFGDYWYQGKAEITSYTLKQARYGEIHDGHAVLIFVTEDFSASKQVKLDNPQEAGDDAVKILKLNATREFNTGIYPYSIMGSVYSPIDRVRYPHPLKINMSVQEWCGQAFVQMNLRGEQYQIQQYSYFEREGDRTIALDAVIPEDEIWTTIRLNPSDLPTGSVRMIPGTLYQRFSHATWDVQNATATLKADIQDANLMAYTISYPDINRTLTIKYNPSFPYEIESWEETARSGFGRRAKMMTTTSVRNKRIMTAYWSKNHVADLGLRGDLGLD